MKFIAVHGGAGKRSDKEVRSKALDAVMKALDAGIETLKSGSAIDAVVAAVVSMEDSPYLNAGIGSAPNLLGKVEMDACLATEEGCGAVANTTIARNPILLAKRVMETDHLLLVGKGADMLAEALGIAVDSNEFFLTERNKKRRKEAVRVLLGDTEDLEEEVIKKWNAYIDRVYPKLRELINYYSQFISFSDTVGAVAFDGEHLAAATSTGGVFLKLPGRVGDSPIFGAGTYVDHNIAISCSGIGEQIMKTLLAKTIATLYAYGLPLEHAVKSGILMASKDLANPSMGAIAASREGIAIYHVTEAFVAGYAKLEGSKIVERKVSDVRR